ncbi:ATP-binding response regulator [Sphingomonas xinjiangensis]|nr:ATP-binding protein [Sphingomonas xinjiangensis]
MMLLAAQPGHAAPASETAPAIAAAAAAAKASMVADPEQALVYAGRIDILARKLPDPRRRKAALATARWLAGEADLRLNEVQRAGPLLADGIRLLEGADASSKLRGDLLMSQGAFLAATGKAAQALANYQAAHRIFSSADEDRSAAIALQNIAMLYSAANDLERAERYYVRAANTFGGDVLLSLSLRNNLGGLFLRADRYADAEVQFGRALASARAMRDPALEARILSNLARAQIDLRKFDEAAATLDHAFSLLKPDNNTTTRRQLLATAARLSADRGDLANATRLVALAFDALDLSATGAEFSGAHGIAYKVYGETGEAKLALVHLEALKRLNDEAAKVATTTSAALMGAKFDYQGQQLTIARLTSEQLRKAAEFQRTLFFSLGGATLAVIAMLSWGLITIRRSRNRVRDANIVLHHTNTALEKALAAKTEFLATTSHEIRTPLNGILGMTQVMLSANRLDADVRERIGLVHGAGLTMRSLVDDILDLAKMETGNLTVDPQPMDLRTMLGEVTKLWEEQAHAKGLAFRLDLAHAPDWIVCDAGRLRQIVFNLLSNAVKFTLAGGITVRALQQGTDEQRELSLIVADSGIGIPQDKFEEIFQSFHQVDASTTRRFGGTGLGLAICRNIAHALAGSIRVESSEGTGTAFTLTLPLVLAEAPEEERPVAGPSILLVEGNPIARSTVRALLQPHGITVQFASDPKEALTKLEEGDVLTLLLDEATLNKAAEGGASALERLVSAAKDARVIVLSRKDRSREQDPLLGGGVFQVLEKPFSASDLLPVLQTRGGSGNDRASTLVSRAA